MQCKSFCGYAREPFGSKSQIKQYEINLRCPFLLCTPLRIQVIKLSRQGIGNRLNDNILYSQCFSSWTIYVSRNQLHCTANLNSGLGCKKAKHCWALSQTLQSCSTDVFSWSCFASCWIGAKIQILQNSCMTKWFYKTEVREIYL